MSKIKLFSGILSLAILINGIAFAETTKESLEKIILEKNNMAASTTDAFIKKLIEKKSDDKRLEILKGYNSAYKNLYNLVVRAESRISKMEKDGLNMSAQKILLTTAKANVELVKIDIEKITNKLSEQTSSSTKKAIIADLKSENKKIAQDIKIAHSSLAKLIISLKPIQEKTTSTSTNQ